MKGGARDYLIKSSQGYLRLARAVLAAASPDAAGAIPAAREVEALRRRTAQLERESLEHREFPHVAAHELQAPLRVVEREVQTLREPGRASAPDTERILESAYEGVRRMPVLIDDHLAYSSCSATSWLMP